MSHLFFVCFLGLMLTMSAYAEIVEPRELLPFSFIDAEGISELEVTNGEVQKVEVVGEVSQVRAVSTIVEDGELVITARTSRGRERPVRVLVRARRVSGIDVSGTMKVKVRAVRGEFDFDLSGAVVADVQGQARRFNVSISGASEVKAEPLVTDSVEADLSGAALLEITVKERLAVDASGGSRVIYRGKPKKLLTELSGLATVTALSGTTAQGKKPPGKAAQ